MGDCVFFVVHSNDSPTVGAFATEELANEYIDQILVNMQILDEMTTDWSSDDNVVGIHHQCRSVAYNDPHGPNEIPPYFTIRLYRLRVQQAFGAALKSASKK